MKTQMDLLTKYLLGGELEKVKVVDAANRHDKADYGFEEEARFLSNQGGFQTYNFENQV